MTGCKRLLGSSSLSSCGIIDLGCPLCSSMIRRRFACGISKSPSSVGVRLVALGGGLTGFWLGVLLKKPDSVCCFLPDDAISVSMIGINFVLQWHWLDEQIAKVTRRHAGATASLGTMPHFPGQLVLRPSSCLYILKTKLPQRRKHQVVECPCSNRSYDSDSCQSRTGVRTLRYQASCLTVDA